MTLISSVPAGMNRFPALDHLDGKSAQMRAVGIRAADMVDLRPVKCAVSNRPRVRSTYWSHTTKCPPWLEHGPASPAAQVEDSAPPGASSPRHYAIVDGTWWNGMAPSMPGQEGDPFAGMLRQEDAAAH